MKFRTLWANVTPTGRFGSCKERQKVTCYPLSSAPPHSYHEKVTGVYPVSLRLRYKATSKLGQLQGFGQTTMMSSKDIIFAPSVGLEPGMNAEIVVDWPGLLDDRHLQLLLRVTITGKHDGVAEARILAYHFRTQAIEGSGEGMAAALG